MVDFSQRPFPKLYLLPPVPDALSEMRNDPRDCCVLEAPGDRDGYTPFSYYATVHQKPVYLSGQTARKPPGRHRRVNQSDLLRQIDLAYHGHVLPEHQPGIGAKLAREVHEQRVGWILLALGDLDLLKRGRNRKEPEFEALKALDRFLQQALPIESVALAMDEEDCEAWRNLPAGDRRSANCLFRIYRLRLEEEGTSSDQGGGSSSR